ncbi:ATP-binding protein [Amycolatopsis sp. 195334CR]|uniref:ATP-binding protein n=1 Tax=Amycolatopsis sp. 195334CR TaxID=2814588 RepID=UPI001A8CB0F5|nr:ATP-binding protein [Amycolatopsis sp. 195334CR]MBN6033699.1 SpoIIE family protein phosphatase [Amycolatopsis sp. 195334CR]
MTVSVSATTPTRRVRIDHPSAVYAATRAARAAARDAALPDVLAERAAVVTSELASNLDKHATGGSVFIQRALTGRGVDVLTADDGPGMADLAHWLVDGNTTTSTLGSGLGAIGRMSTTFQIRSTPGTGTTTAARVLAPGTPAGPADAVGHFCLPREGEQHCGDAIALAEDTGSRTVVVADGLGHGPDAAEAADLAIGVFGNNPDRALSAQLAAMHRALRGTRGAAVALARVSGRGVEFCGVGNVSATILTPGRSSQLLLSVPGVVGFILPAVLPRHAPLTGGAVVVLHTDGIDHSWRAPLPPAQPAGALLLAAELAHRHRNPRDDAAAIALHADQLP